MTLSTGLLLLLLFFTLLFAYWELPFLKSNFSNIMLHRVTELQPQIQNRSIFILEKCFFSHLIPDAIKPEIWVCQKHCVFHSSTFFHSPHTSHLKSAAPTTLKFYQLKARLLNEKHLYWSLQARMKLETKQLWSIHAETWQFIFFIPVLLRKKRLWFG